ncbi:MAG: Glutamine--tRNA ligase [Methanobacteriota archaeon]|nr:MAG: Glutamine--tRNA ligase [Euryarchaeota archaeon]
MAWSPDSKLMENIYHLSIQNSLQYEGKGQLGSVMGKVMGTFPEARKHAKELTGIIKENVEKANNLAKEKGFEHLKNILEENAPELLEKKVKEKRTGLPDLKNAEDGEVVLRFAPNPNGPLSFGHSRGVVINSEYAKRYDGKWILRFDDTDTVRKPPLPEAYQLIQEEVEWLTGKPADKVVIASNRIETYYEFASKLIKKGGAYVCTLSADDFREFRQNKTNSPDRSRSPEENLKLWEKMLNGEFSPGEAVVRIKTDMTLPNPALRDWPALRIQDTESNPHPRNEIKSKYKVWPLLDFQSAIEDHLQGVTHIIRGKDLMDSTRKQTLLYNHFEWTYPETVYWGRVKIHEFGGFSTSGMRTDIEEGKYIGWDDSRLPTLASMRRRGFSAEGLRNFWIELALTQKDISASMATIYSHNVKIIDESTPRLFFVREPIEIKLENGNEEIPLVFETQVHPEDMSLGLRKWKISNANTTIYLEKIDLELAKKNNNKIRLKDFADIEIIENKAKITSIDPSEKLPIIHWLDSNNCIKATLETTTGDDLKYIHGMLEKSNHVKSQSIVQLERIGYAKLENKNELIFLHD